ncbi:MAG: hypothetical protein NT002_03260 [candidate division Zixibacteria bacterium]|nr:hypothetical protein [candidate division Zixibacteria bacterium]
MSIRINQLPIFARVILPIVVLIIVPIGSHENGIESSYTPIPQKALQRAVEYTGFLSISNFDVQKQPAPEMIMLFDDQTPFVHEKINGRHIWSASFTNIDLRNTVADTSSRKSVVHNFQVLLDSAEGCLLRISTITQQIDSNIAPVKSAVDAEAQMLSSGDVYQVYSGPAPKISLLQALDSCMHSPKSAKQIDAVLLMYSRPGYARYQTPRLVWFITLRGIPPIYFHPPRGTPQPPTYARNFIHEIIDATTGRGLFATTVPTPAPRK